MSIIPAERPATVPGRQVRRAEPARGPEVAITHKRDGSWVIDRESASHPGLVHVLRVSADGTAEHATGPACPAYEHGKPCTHLADAPGLVGYGVEIALHLGRIAQERAFGPEWRSEEFIELLQTRIDVCVVEANRRYGVNITKVVEEAAL